MTRKLILAIALAASVLSGGVAIAADAQTPAARADAAPPPPPPPPPGGPARAMMRADANGDGIVTKQEWLAEATRHFDLLDRNRDGKLDASEMQRPGGGRGGRMRGPRSGGDMPPPPPPADD